MTQLTLEPGGRLALVSNIDLSGRRPGEQPVFFYDGDFGRGHSSSAESG